MDEKSERTTNGGVGSVGVASFERSGLRGVYMKTKLTDTPDYSKALDFNHHELVDNIAIFTALALLQVGERSPESRCVRL